MRQLIADLETTQVFIANHVVSEEVASTELPENRKSFAFVQAVLKHNLSPSTINDAITTLEELQFQVKRCREDNEIAFQFLFRLYDVQRFRTLRKRPSTVSVASSVAVASISNRIEEEASMSAGENEGHSSNPIEWLQEQARQAALHPPIASPCPQAPVECTPRSGDETSGDVSAF